MECTRSLVSFVPKNSSSFAMECTRRNRYAESYVRYGRFVSFTCSPFTPSSGPLGERE